MRLARRLGIALLLLAVLVVVVRGVSSILSGSSAVEPGSTLVVELGGTYVESPESPLMARLFGGGGRPFVGLLS